MPVNSGIRKLLLQALDKAPEDIPLNLSSGILGLAIFVKPPNIADADGVGIVTLAVGSGHFKRTTLFDGSVKPDDIVVANHLEAPGFVPAVDVGSGEVLALGSGGTVEDDFGDLSHSQNLILITQNTQNTQKRMMQMIKDHL